MDLERALTNPTAVFASPGEVCQHPELSRDEKVQILRRWEYDARELQVADEENMAGDATDQLEKVLAALQELGEPATARETPTKHGGE